MSKLTLVVAANIPLMRFLNAEWYVYEKSFSP